MHSRPLLFAKVMRWLALCVLALGALGVHARAMPNAPLEKLAVESTACTLAQGAQVLDASEENTLNYGARMSGPTIYAYAHSDPVHNADPSGEMSLGETGAAGSIQGTLSSLALPNMARQGLEFARRAKIFDVYDYAMWPLHFYMYVERSGGAPRIRYDVGNGSGWGGMLRRNPFGVIPGGFVSASPVTNRSQNQGRSLKIVSLTFGQWLTWHVSVVGTEEQSCVIPRPYSLTPGMGTNCLSWTVWASAKALAISRLPL